MFQVFTRKPCYRKDDHAMRPIAYMGALKILEVPAWLRHSKFSRHF